MKIFENFTKIFSNIWPKSDFFENVTKTKIKSFPNFRKFCPKSKFYDNFTKNFSKIWPKSEFYENVTKMEIFRNFRKKIENFYRTRFFLSFTRIEIFRNFQSNRNFRKFLLKSKFFENFTKIEIFRKFDPNRNFSKISPKSKFLEIFTKKSFEISQISQIFLDFRKVWPNSKFCRKFH